MRAARPLARSARATAIGARDLALALALSGLGALGTLPGAQGEPDPRAALVWLALVAMPVGFLAGASRLRLWPLATVVPAIWMVALCIADGLSRRDLPSPVFAALAFTGLFAAGFAGGTTWPHLLWRGSASLFLVMALLSSACLLGLHLSTPLPSHLRARLLDISPVTFLAECAGLDWMRQPVIYDAVATVDIDPSMRSAWSSGLAGGIVFVVGSLIALAADRRARRHTPRPPDP